MSSVCQRAILFADISGSTRLYEMLGDERAHAVVRQTLAVCAGVVAQTRGVIVKTIGDELMAAFDAPKDGYEAAIQLQRKVGDLPPLNVPGAVMKIAVRIGLHFGSAVHENGDYFGDAVNIAARMVGLAKATQIIATADVLQMLGPEERARAHEFGRIDVKGRVEPVRVAQIEWSERPSNVTLLQIGGAAQASQQPSAPRLRLVFEGRNWHVPNDMRAITCGRDGDSQLVLKGPQVSRAHATIEFRRGKCFLVDHSTNGTWLMLDDQPPLRLHREEFGLLKHGCIVFGSMDSEESDTLWFYFD